MFKISRPPGSLHGVKLQPIHRLESVVRDFRNVPRGPWCNLSRRKPEGALCSSRNFQQCGAELEGELLLFSFLGPLQKVFLFYHIHIFLLPLMMNQNSFIARRSFRGFLVISHFTNSGPWS